MSGKATLSNDKIVVLAAFLAGADKGLADTEDIAMRANDLAPGKFTWRKYQEQINIEAVRKRLYDAAKESRGGLIAGGEREGWLLTSAGIAFCKEHAGLLERGLSFSPRLSAKERTWQHRERIRMLAEAAYRKWKAGEADQISKQEAERFFAVDDYIKDAARAKRVERSGQVFRGDPELEEAISEIGRILGGYH
ncbi:hypothetical protein LY632_05015 [Erythrobacter sp. SDW2]|uniref:hypothetical protein n=1 Tax=Erythrobacter sp. SDW2 TaxID=2907154 RepID=UPI001F2CF152|nr:hypothetical protein [Erythrobacter sp. SDW2]UIP07762.1 hypothetical protein LY632_05015 [Erythrobacter sp. SDW2]